MNSLKMKFKLHELEFELEGSEATVKREFENFKSFTIDLISKVNVAIPHNSPIPQGQQFTLIEQPKEVQLVELSSGLPTLKDVKLRDLAKGEGDWLLVYVYYATAGGTKEFTREDVIQLYKDSDRWTEARRKSLSAYVKSASKAQYIKSTNDINFILLDKGKAKALEIFNGKSTATARTHATRIKSAGSKKTDIGNGKAPKEKKSKPASSVNFVDLKLTPTEQKSLSNFFETKQPKTQNEKVLVAMKWYADEKKAQEISLEEMNYLLSIAVETPSALGQVLINMAGPSFRWMAKGDSGNYHLTSIGESYVVNKLPKK